MAASELMRRQVGCVVPIWYPPDMPEDEMRGFLAATLADVELFIAPERLALVVDGCPRAVGPTHQAAEGFAERAGGEPQVIVEPHNGGKGAALCEGFERLLADEQVTAVCTRDADADHDIYDLPQMFRLLCQMRDQEGGEDVFVVGCRGSVTRPLGFARGALEQVLNRVTVAAVNHHLAAEGRAVDERYTGRYGPFPDFQSGYKLYSRSAAQVAVEGLRAADRRWPDLDVMRWGSELIPTVELLARGFVPGAIYRLTWDGQPQTTFDSGDLPRRFSRQLAWVFDRLQTPPRAAAVMLDNALSASEYVTAPEGEAHLAAIREQVAAACFPDTDPHPPAMGGDFI
ncbi:MAG: hypothetical protein J7M38_06250 [Armatimonadetes bacterium]|nr:hypothetical protein [Armatimonadota bacterium]